jgi:4-alpha-glucanotransferase
MENNLKNLAKKLGIATTFSDSGIHKQTYDVSEKTVRFFCRQLGYKADTPEDAVKSLQKFEKKRLNTPLDPILVLKESHLSFELRLKKSEAERPLKLTVLTPENKIISEPAFSAECVFETVCGRSTYKTQCITLKESMPYGYYRLNIVCGKESFQTVLAIVPEKCYTTEDVESGRLWGYSLQLYSLKSRRNWGIGDFTDLKEFVRLCAKSGADVIGLNPLNVMFHDFPENASPYSSINRLFLNPIYIDPQLVPAFSEKIKQKIFPEIEDIKSEKLINYTKVYQLKISVLKELFEMIDKFPTYKKEFEAFQKKQGTDLERLAVYQALYSEQSQTVWGGWRAWKKELQTPSSAAVTAFAKAHQKEIEFFKFLQFEADRQLKSVYLEVRKCGLKIGLYRDLPVGVCKDSAELWADRYVFMDQVGAGAPPDAFFPCGQKWCLGAFHPFELKERAYEPFLKIIRANMRYAGALRIDHVMGLMRLFMIPDDQNEGTYVYYNFEDMLGLVALESYLNKCVVVGESIGNVPDGFLDALKQHRIHAISVLWSERWNGNGDFKMPKDYASDAFVSVGTHDMPPLKMWWFGYEIELMNRLKMLTDEEKTAAYHQREADRKMLLAALDFNGVWPADRLRQSDYLYGQGYPEGLEEAAHRLLAQSAARVVMLQPEDIFEVDELQNLPGTDRDQYPSWRHRLPIDLEDMEQSEAYARNTALIRRFRH